MGEGKNACFGEKKPMPWQGRQSRKGRDEKKTLTNLFRAGDAGGLNDSKQSLNLLGTMGKIPDVSSFLGVNLKKNTREKPGTAVSY